MAAFRTRLCLVTDIVGYSSHAVPERDDAERRLYAIQQFALARAGAFRVRALRREDRGDGQLLLLPPTLDPHAAIPRLVAGLRHGLYLANAEPGPFGRLRIRVSLAQGAISGRGPLGFRGDALIVACRLNDAEPFKAALARDEAADLGFIVPDDLYRDVIRHDCGSLRSAEFTQVTLNVKEYEGTAWMYLPPGGPVPDVSGAQATSMWRTAAAGALVAGLVVATLPVPHPDPLPGDGQPADWPAAGGTGHADFPHPGGFPPGFDSPGHLLHPGIGHHDAGTGWPDDADAWPPNWDDAGDGTVDPGALWPGGG